ncbi:spore coat protein [Mycoplasmatota bacterium WC44]
MSIINQPPNVLSVKDNIYIRDMLTSNLMGIKTVNEFRNMTTDPEIKNLLDSVQNMHKKHYDILLNSLENCEN